MAIDPETRTGTVHGYEIKAYAELAHADLNRVDLKGANLSHANLLSARLIGTRLHDAILWRADLRGARMMDAELIRADLAQADLFKAELGGADLTEANLWGANLDSANLLGADLTGANLTGANFRGARVEPHHVPLIEAAHRHVISSLTVIDDPHSAQHRAERRAKSRVTNPRGRKRTRNGGHVFFLDRNDNVWETCSVNDVDGVNFGPRGAARRISRKAYTGFDVVGHEDDWRIVELRFGGRGNSPF
jgi:hypothetical protein